MKDARLRAVFHTFVDGARVDHAGAALSGLTLVKVHARGLGLVLCGGQWRWMWGRLDEVFVVSGQPSNVRVRVWSPFGRAKKDVPTSPHPRPVSFTAPRLRVRVRPLASLAPRVLSERYPHILPVRIFRRSP